MYYLLYNPGSKKVKSLKKIDKLQKRLEKKDRCYRLNITEIEQQEKVFLSQRGPDDWIIICGGDGTVNQFINRINGEEIKCHISVYKFGSGNDLAREFKGNPFEITSSVKDLPKLILDNSDHKVFINGAGMGIDAEICKTKAKYKHTKIKKSYAKVTVESFHTFKPYDLDAVIDGKEYHFKKVWFFVVNNGKYFGGGMKIAPKAVRGDDYLDCCIVHGIGIRKLLMIFPLVYLGWHLIAKKAVFYVQGKNFSFKPTGTSILQMDGEVLENIKEITIEK